MRQTSLIILATVILAAACATPSAPEVPPAAEPATDPQVKQTPPARPAQVPVPQPLRLTGEESPGAAIVAELEAEGMSVVADFEGRSAGIETMCSGAADGLALSRDLDDSERRRCKELGGSWSALSDEDGRILYVRYAIAKDLLDRSEAF